jgi:CRISPR-associated protein Cmr5
MAQPDGARAPAAQGTHTRDQRRALHAYQAVAGVVSKKQREDYETAVKGLGANILRSGLAAAMAALERLGDGDKTLLHHLATADVPGLDGATSNTVPDRVRQLDVDAYMIATREMIAVATWLKRAAQATFE